MSQSDYIKFKRSTEVLKNQTKLQPILDPSDYTSFETYNLETTVQNTKNAFSRLHLPSSQTFFDIEKSVSNCATFPLCTNTNNRINRVLNTEQKIKIGNTTIPYKPDPTYKLNKIFKPNSCSFSLQNGKVQRSIWCGKTICKCGLRYYSTGMGNIHPKKPLFYPMM